MSQPAVIASFRQPPRPWAFPVPRATGGPRAMATLLLSVLLVGIASALEAQRGGGAPPFDGPRGAVSFELSDGEPVSFYLEWSRWLGLTEPQKTALIDIRRRLRLQNAPFMRQLDSLRELAGIDMTPRGRLTERDREAFQRFEQWSAPLIDSIRVNNEGARREIRAVLDARQWARADSVQAELRDVRGRRRERPKGPARDARSDAAWLVGGAMRTG